MYREIENVLDKIGIKLNNVGYNYLVQAVYLRHMNKQIALNKIYEVIAQRYKTKVTTVERNIRYCYENEERKKKISEYFNVEYNITNESLILLIEREVYNKVLN